MVSYGVNSRVSVSTPADTGKKPVSVSNFMTPTPVSTHPYEKKTRSGRPAGRQQDSPIIPRWQMSRQQTGLIPI